MNHGLLDAVNSSEVTAVVVGPGCVRRDLPCPAGLRAWVVEMAAGSVWPHVDEHPEGESVYVLDGELIEGRQRYRAGTYLDFKPGSSHRPRTETGVRLFGINPVSRSTSSRRNAAGPTETPNRVLFDFTVTFTNGGSLRGEDFRLDINGDSITDAALAAALVEDLRLLMVGTVIIHHKRIISEAHKRKPAASTVR